MALYKRVKKGSFKRVVDSKVYVFNSNAGKCCLIWFSGDSKEYRLRLGGGYQALVDTVFGVKSN